MPHKTILSLSSDKRERMFSLVEQYMNGNQTRKDFCQEHGINLNTFPTGKGNIGKISKERIISFRFRLIAISIIGDQQMIFARLNFPMA